MSPTQRSLKYLRDRGYLVAIVEHWNPFARIRNDLFGFIDLLALSGTRTLAIQTTTASNMSARATKIRNSKHLAPVIDAGWTVKVHGWKKPTKKHPKWSLKELDIADQGRLLSVPGDPS